MDKNVYITGTSKGIGYSIKEKFNSQGWNTNKHNSEVINLSEVQKVNEFFKKEFLINPPTTLVLNASENKNLLFNELDHKNIEKTLSINLTSNLFIIQNAIEHMVKNKFGRIVLIGSIWSKKTRASKSIYSITKSSLIGLCNTLTVEFSKENILTNIVSPGFVNTEMTEQNLSFSDKEEFLKRIPQQRFSEPKEIAELVYFLGSENNTYITGQEIFIDGGFNIG